MPGYPLPNFQPSRFRPLSALGAAIIVGDQTASFGALTLASAGGWRPIDSQGNEVALSSVTDQTGTTRTWSISGGRLVADGPPGVDDGQTLALTTAGGDQFIATISASANEYSAASAAEMAAAWADASIATAQGIRMRDGDYRTEARQSLTAKAFTNTFTIQPHTNFTPAALAYDNVHTVHLPGIVIDGGNSAAVENVLIYGLNLYETLDDAVAESSGVFEIMDVATSRNVTIQSCRISSRSFESAFDAGIIGDGPGFTAYPSQSAFFADADMIRGVVMEDVAHASVIDSFIHDVTRGVRFLNVSADGANNSRIEDNYIQDILSNFTTVGNSSDVDIINNFARNCWGSDLEVPSNPLHFAVGGSFDPGCSDITMKGNRFVMGGARKKYTEDAGQTFTAVMGATGAKFNDPNDPAAYTDIFFAHNLIVSHGICFEVSGGDGITTYNNTLVSEDYSKPTGHPGLGTPTYYFQGAANLKLYNNIGAGYTLGAQDAGGTENGQTMVDTLATAQGYGNYPISNHAGALAVEDVFEGDPTKGFDLLDWDEIEAAYTPKTGNFALTSTEKKGAIGTGYWTGTTDTAPAFAARSATAANYAPTTTVWDGSTYALRGGSLSNVSDGRHLTIAWQGELHADADGTDFYFLEAAGARVSVRHLPGNTLRFRLENEAGDLAYEADSQSKITSSDGIVAFAVSFDLDEGRATYALNGEPDALPMSPVDSVLIDDIDLTTTQWAIHATTAGARLFKGNFDALLITDTFIDLETDAGLSKIFATDGLFNDWGADGSSIDGSTELVVIRGKDASAINGGTMNGGDGGAFTVSGGTVADLAAGIVVDEASSGGTFRSSGGFRIWEADNSASLVVTTGGDFNILRVAGGASGGSREGGGGGAGGYLSQTAITLSPATYSATIGAGGATQTASGSSGNAGGNTTFNGISVAGGGPGGGLNGAGITGGASGGSGGGSGLSTSPAPTPLGSELGFKGGDSPTNTGSGGGGGSGGAGVDGTSSSDGDGGAGVASPVPGDSIAMYCGGGGGGLADGSGGSGGASTAGDGGTGSQNGQPATANSGSGGGGGASTFGNRDGGAGASGRVVVWWPE